MAAVLISMLPGPTWYCVTGIRSGASRWRRGRWRSTSWSSCMPCSRGFWIPSEAFERLWKTEEIFRGRGTGV